MIDGPKVVKHERKSRLKLLSKFPCFVHADCGVVQDVADEVEACDLAGDGRSVY
jgi:hypothetical protein